jgi:outer membrane protein assembly factor BamB
MVFLASVLADDWTMYRGDAAATARTKTDLTAEHFKTVWEYKTDTGIFETSPIVAGNTVFAGASDDGFIAVNLQTGKLRWRHPLQTGITAPALFYGNNVFFGDTDGVFHCLDAQTGNERWTFSTKSAIDNSANVDTAARRVLVGSQSGSLYALEAATGKVVWEYKTGDQIRCFPTISERRCFVAGCDSHLHVIDLDTGKGVAKVPLDSPTGSTPLVAGDYVYFGTEGNEFLAVDWKRAEVRWRFAVKQAVRSPAALIDNTVIFGGFDKTVYALNIQDGKMIWQYRTKGRIEGGGVVTGESVFIPSGDSNLYEFDWKSGKLVKTIPATGKLLSSPAVLADGFILTTENSLLRIAAHR